MTRNDYKDEKTLRLALTFSLVLSCLFRNTKKSPSTSYILEKNMTNHAEKYFENGSLNRFLFLFFLYQ